MQWLMLKQKEPEDFVKLSCEAIGVKIGFKGTGLDEVGYVLEINTQEKSSIETGDIVLKIDKKYYRPAEVNTLLGNPEKASKNLDGSHQ